MLPYRSHSRLLLIVACEALVIVPSLALAGQPLETETARLPLQGQGNIQIVAEYQTSSAGQEFAIPLAFEYGITNRIELAIEPVPYTSIRPKEGRSASGLGDTEATLTYLLTHETGNMPAIAIAGEVKFPTARDPLIGTKATDYRGVVILSKRFGDFDAHANFGYTFVGSPPGASLGNIFDYAVAVEYFASKRTQLVAEVIGNTSSGSGEGSPSTGGTIIPEAAGGEVVGLIGVRHEFNDSVAVSLGVTYDNNHAILFRPGLTIAF